jgi:hypothetical protein
VYKRRKNKKIPTEHETKKQRVKNNTQTKHTQPPKHTQKNKKYAHKKPQEQRKKDCFPLCPQPLSQATTRYKNLINYYE